MLHFQFKNSDFIAIAEDDNIPYVCGLERNKDIFFAIKISIYKNNNNKKGRIISRYGNMWETPTSKDAITEFISKILMDITFRKDFLLTDLSWNGVINYDFSTFNQDTIELNYVEEECSLTPVKQLKPLRSGLEFSNNNLSLKLDVISLFISDDDIEHIESKLNYRPAIIYTIKQVIEGVKLDVAINSAINTFSLHT